MKAKDYICAIKSNSRTGGEGGEIKSNMNALQKPVHDPGNSLVSEFKSPLICSLLSARNPITSPRAPRFSARTLGRAAVEARSSGTRALPAPQTGPVEMAEPAPQQRPGFTHSWSFAAAAATKWRSSASGNP